ncbi:MICAL-like protein 1 isoform X2 [Asterias rubens]|uniref:MICAL-like protein 1 isoform X2 n=1 Tax=Asterias rubens TaxID=7604 RepID=UPI00145580ED|nr:MICAL-like protein 1 isoform X2 [Asterias rubens]
MPLTGTKALLVWAQRTTEGYRDVKVANMQKSWKDGLAFCAILHHYRPDLIDFNSLSKENVRQNNALAFDVAEQELGIPALLDPDDMAVMTVPDKLSVMTYVSQYYNYFKDKKPVKDDGGPKTRMPSKRAAEDSPINQVASKQPSRGDSCGICDKKVYLMERQVADGKIYHRNCFRCNKCRTTLRPGSYKSTSDPKQFECLQHGDNIWKLRSNMSSRAAKENKQPSDSGSSGIWETRSGVKPAVVKEDQGGSIWGTRQGASPAATKEVSKPSQGNGISDTQQGTKPFPVKKDKDERNAASLSEKSTTQGVQPQNRVSPPSSAIPMHPHLLASKASRERFNSPMPASQMTKQQPQKEDSNPFGSSSETPKKISPNGVQDEETRLGLLASLAAVRGNSKPGTASIEDLSDALEGNTGQKLADEGDSREASPSGSRKDLTTQDQAKSQDINSEPNGHDEVLSVTTKTSEPESPFMDSANRDSILTSSDVLSLTSLSSISQMGTSETSSLDTEQFANEIEAENRSSMVKSSRYSSGADEEAVVNLSDSFCQGFNKDRVEGDTASTASATESDIAPIQITVEVDNSKEPVNDSPEIRKDSPVPTKGTPEAETGSKKKSKSGDYDESLNPFGDDDEGEDEEQPEKEDTGYKNPFDDSDSEENEKGDYDNDLNPFGDADDDEPTEGGPVTQWPPLPAGTKLQSEIPSQQGSYKVKTRQDILREMQRDRNTLKKSQKRRAPPRPQEIPGRPMESPGKTPPSETAGAAGLARAPPRSTKSRPAPTPPKENGQPSESKVHPDKPSPFQPRIYEPRAYSVGSKPMPSPRTKKHIIPGKEDNGRISPIPAPRRKISEGAQKVEDGEGPVPSPRQRRATDATNDKTKFKPSRPLTAPPRPPSRSPTQASKKRAPAPPPIKREVGKDHMEPTVIMRELKEIEIRQRDKEAKGVSLEKKLREDMKGSEGQDNEDLLIEWFALVNEKNQLVRREGELVAQAQMQDLELQQAEIEYELRCLMHKHEHQKTDADVVREEKLLEMLVEVVTKRSQIVERLEDDRKREQAEDQDIQIMMEQSGLDKKHKEKKKHKKKKSIGLLGK